MQETVTFSGTIIGEGQRVDCEVRAIKTTLVGDRPLVSGYWIVESDVTDGLPDGNYELLVNREKNSIQARRRTVHLAPILIAPRQTI